MQNPWNFIIPLLKVSGTKAQGFFYSRVLQTLVTLGTSEQNVRGDRNTKSLKFY